MILLRFSQAYIYQRTKNTKIKKNEKWLYKNINKKWLYELEEIKLLWVAFFGFFSSSYFCLTDSFF